MINIVQHVSFTEILNFQFSNTLTTLKEHISFLFSLGQKKRMFLLKELCLFKEPVGEIQCFHLTEV